MKYCIDVLDCKFSERQLEEIFAIGGIPAPQDGSFRVLKTKISDSEIKEWEKRGYRSREAGSYIEFVH